MDPETPLSKKLWLASKIQGHRNPFGKPLTDYTIWELDWVLEMEALDRPKELSFSRNGQEPVTSAQVMAAWASTLTGAALVRFMKGKWSPKATAVSQAQKGIGLKPGITKGGKPIAPDNSNG